MHGIYSKNIITPQKTFDGVIEIENGKIKNLFQSHEISSHLNLSKIPDHLFLLPGLVDTHVHVNEPGRTEWEGFETATQAAAMGGITTVFDMPLNCIPVTTSQKALEIKKQEMSKKLWIDIGFHGGIIPGNFREIEPLIKMGVKSFKAFMIHSGIDEFPNCTEKDLEIAMPILAKHNIPLLVHAELELSPMSCPTTPDGRSARASFDKSSYQEFLSSRPKEWEDEAIRLIIRLSEKFHCPVHIVHLSSSSILPELKKAKARGVPITAETCPHYLVLESETIPDGDGRFKCTPPIREKENQEKLWQGLCDGVIDFIVSDHSPCTPQLKKLDDKNLWGAWGGISSLQFGLSLIWTAMKKKNIPLENITKWMSDNPAKLVRVDHSKGKIAKDYDADFIVFDPNAKQVIEKKMIYHRHPLTPYENKEVWGKVHATYLRGEKIEFKNEPRGKLL